MYKIITKQNMFSTDSLGKCLQTKDCNWDVDTLKPVYYSPIYKQSASVYFGGQKTSYHFWLPYIVHKLHLYIVVTCI